MITIYLGICYLVLLILSVNDLIVAIKIKREDPILEAVLVMILFLFLGLPLVYKLS